MKIKKLKGGDILQISLPADLGFAYAKYIDLSKLDKDTLLPDLIRVYNYRSPRPVTDPKNLINTELILCPLLIAGIVPAIASRNWQIVASEPIAEEDKVIPHFKRMEEHKMKEIQWYYVIDADNSKKIRANYESVKHLEFMGAIGSDLVGTKIAMALLKDEGEKIEDYFSLQDFFEKDFYNDVTGIPAYYLQPKEIQGRALTSDVETRYS